MRKIKNVKINDYVLVSRWGDHKMEDPWHIGYISEYGQDASGLFYRVKESDRYWRNVFRINEKEAEERLKHA